MKRRSIFWGTIFVIVIMLCACGVNGEDKGTLDKEVVLNEMTSQPIKINNKFYVGNLPVYFQEGEYYFPISKLAEMMDMDYAFDGGQSVKLGTYEINNFSDHIVIQGNEPYIKLSYLNEMGGVIHVYKDDLEYREREIIYIDNYEERFDYSWLEYEYISHAFGGIDGYSYTNSLEAFEYNYEKGHRVFEVDFSLTADEDLVAVHDWSENTIINVCGLDIPEEKKDQALTKEEFLSYKIQGIFTPLSFYDVAVIMKEHPDIYIVTDTKETEDPYISKQFEQMRKIGEEVDPEILDRIIPQIYNEEMFRIIMNIYDWKSIIYTLYNQGMGFSEENTINFAYKEGIKVITTYTSRAQTLFLKELLERNMVIYMHTYNTSEEVEYLKKEKGIKGVYTDFLLPE